MSHPPGSREITQQPDLSWLDDMRLTPNQSLFIKEYLIDFNASAAYQRAKPGTPLNTAGTSSCLLLKNQKVKGAVRRAILERMIAVGIKAERVLRELAYIGLFDPVDVIDFGRTIKLKKDIPEHARRAISSIKVKQVLERTARGMKPAEITEIRFWDKNSALDKLCKHLGLYDADNKQKAPAPTGPAKEEIDDLELPIEVRIALLEAIQKKRQKDTERNGAAHG